MSFWRRLKRIFVNLKRIFVKRQPIRYIRDGANVTAMAFVTDTKQKGTLTREEALEMQQQILSVMNSSDFGVKISAASRLLLGGAHQEAIAAYEQIASAHPDRIGICQIGIGAAHYFLGNYEIAIDFYERALANGEDPTTIDDNIEEARQAIAKLDHHRRWLDLWSDAR